MWTSRRTPPASHARRGSPCAPSSVTKPPPRWGSRVWPSACRCAPRSPPRPAVTRSGSWNGASTTTSARTPPAVPRPAWSACAANERHASRSAARPRAVGPGGAGARPRPPDGMARLAVLGAGRGRPRGDVDEPVHLPRLRAAEEGGHGRDPRARERPLLGRGVPRFAGAGDRGPDRAHGPAGVPVVVLLARRPSVVPLLPGRPGQLVRGPVVRVRLRARAAAHVPLSARVPGAAQTEAGRPLALGLRSPRHAGIEDRVAFRVRPVLAAARPAAHPRGLPLAPRRAGGRHRGALRPR